MRRLRPLGLSCVLIACSSASEPPAAPGIDVPRYDACADAELPLRGGGCRAIGVPKDGCGQGFVSDAHGGCTAMLPKERCPEGAMALPGETACHEIAPCGTDAYGAIPVDAATLYVDGAFGGGGSTGARDRPFTTIQAAVDAAKPDGVVAIAAGSYAENVVVARPMKLFGRCPAKVEIAPKDTSKPALELQTGVEVRTIAIRGSQLRVSGGTGTLLDGVWVHDSGRDGASVGRIGGSVGVTIRRSLFENNADVSVLIIGGVGTFEDLVIRDSRKGSLDPSGQAISVLGSGTTEIRRCLLERFAGTAVRVDGAEVHVEDTLIRDPLAPAAAGNGSVYVSGGSSTSLKKFSLRGSVVEGSRGGTGVRLGLVDATIERTVVRDARGSYGALSVQGGTVALRASTIAGADAAGVWASGATLEVEDLLVRDIRPDPIIKTFGFGIGAFGAAGDGSSFAMRTSRVSNTHYAGLFFAGTEAKVEDVLVDEVLTREDGAFGDGVAVSASHSLAGPVPAAVSLTRVRVTGARRAGASVFAGRLAMSDATFACSAFPIDLERTWADQFGESGTGDYAIEDRGDNLCGCPTPDTTCVATSSGLSPLAPLKAP